jgi:hypothetical protein
VKYLIFLKKNTPNKKTKLAMIFQVSIFLWFYWYEKHGSRHVGKALVCARIGFHKYRGTISGNVFSSPNVADTG